MSETFSHRGVAADAAYHHLAPYSPPSRFGFREDGGPPLSPHGLDRIAAYFRRMRETAPSRGEGPDMWDMIVRQHRVLVEPLEAGDVERVEFLFRHMGLTPLVWGFSQYVSSRLLKNSEPARRYEATMLVDKLISLAEARRAVPVSNPEQGIWEVRTVDLDRLLRRCFAVDGRMLPAPRAGGGLFGLQTEHGVYGFGDTTGLRAALRVEELLETTGRDAEVTVCEIGGGLGVLAYYSSLLSEKTYRIYDLPTVSVVQAYFLMRSLGEEKVWLWGESDKEASGVALYPHWTFEQYASSTHVFVNQDSMTEINLPEARAYLAGVARSRPDYFLSINEEAKAPDSVGGLKHRVGEIMDDLPEMRRLYRCRDWMRKGWVEELYAPAPGSGR